MNPSTTSFYLEHSPQCNLFRSHLRRLPRLIPAQDAEKGKFKAVPGKYELIETDNSDTTAAAAMVASGGGPSSPARPAKVLPSRLDANTKELVELIFR